MPSLHDWATGARPRTLPAALAPVFAGTGAAAFDGAASPVRALLASGVALALQVAVNFANDYSDGVRGTDDVRDGPKRLTASGAVPPRQVKRAALLSFAVAAVCGVILCALAGTWWLLAVGAISMLAGWYYTGGRRPYGYSGFGEVAVFIFFGLVATLGTTYTQAGRVTGPSVLAAISMGAISCALLMVNNIRDLTTDRAVGKRTLAVRLGIHRARRTYAIFLAGAVASAVAVAFWTPWAWAILTLAAPAWLLADRVLKGAKGRDLIGVLKDTGMLELAIGLGLAVALVV